MFEMPRKVSHQGGNSHPPPLGLRKEAAIGWYLSFIFFSLFFLWPFTTSGMEKVEWEFRESPLGIITFQKRWDNLLLWPSIGFPAFAEPNSTLEVLVLCRWRPQAWRVYVDNTPLVVLGTAENAGVWRLNVQLPDNLGEGLHDLWVEADGERIGERKGRNSLMVVRELPQTPQIAGISDTHVDEENWRVVRFAINPRPLFASKDLRGLPALIRNLLRDLDNGLSRVRDGVIVCRPEHARKLSETLAYIRENIKPDLVLVTGDLVDWSSERSWEKLWEILATSELPVCLVPGNHDHRSRLPMLQGRRWLAPFYRYLNSFDVYGFQLGRYYLVGINSGHDWKPFDSSRGSGLEKVQLSWLLRHLEERENIVIFLHHRSYEHLLGLKYGWEEVLSKKGILMVVCGHSHPPVPRESMVRGVRQIEIPSTRDTQEPAQAVVVLSPYLEVPR